MIFQLRLWATERRTTSGVVVGGFFIPEGVQGNVHKYVCTKYDDTTFGMEWSGWAVTVCPFVG